MLSESFEMAKTAGEIEEIKPTKGRVTFRFDRLDWQISTESGKPQRPDWFKGIIKTEEGVVVRTVMVFPGQNATVIVSMEERPETGEKKHELTII